MVGQIETPTVPAFSMAAATPTTLGSVPCSRAAQAAASKLPKGPRTNTIRALDFHKGIHYCWGQVLLV